MVYQANFLALCGLLSLPAFCCCFCVMAWHFNGLCFSLRLIDVYRGIQKSGEQICCVFPPLVSTFASNNKNTADEKNGYNNDDR